MQKPTQPQPSNRTSEQDEVKKKLGKIWLFISSLQGGNKDAINRQENIIFLPMFIASLLPQENEEKCNFSTFE